MRSLLLALALLPALALAQSTALTVKKPGGASTQVPGNANGALKVAGDGTAGSPSTDVISVQGVASGTAIPVSANSLPLPTNAAQEHVGAASPNACRLSDGAAFYAAPTSGQLPAALDGSGYLKTHEQGTATITGTVTANVGTTNGLALDATLGRSQGSTTAGQTGPLMQGAVTTSAPSYTTAQTSPLSLTPAGALRTDASATTQPVSGTVTTAQATAANLNATVVGNLTNNNAAPAATNVGALTARATAAGPTYTEGNMVVLSTDLDGGLRTIGYGATGTTAGTDGIQVLAQYNSALPTIASGNSAALQTDVNGRLLIGALPAGSNVIGHAITDSGSTTAVTQATASNLNAQVQGAAASGASKSGNPVQVGAVYNSTQPTVTTGQAVEAQATARGALIVAPGVDNTAANAWFAKISDGTNTMAVKAGSAAAAASDPAAVVTISPNLPLPSSSMTNSAASTNATSVKGAAGTVFTVAASNVNASTRYVKLYNKATAPTCGTDTPVLTIAVATGGTVTVPTGFVGLRFSTGIGFCITGAAADSDTTAISAGDVKLIISYL